MADRVLHVRVVSPDRVVHEGEASALVVPAWDGKLGVLPGHAPFLGLLGAYDFYVRKDRPVVWDMAWTTKEVKRPVDKNGINITSPHLPAGRE